MMAVGEELRPAMRSFAGGAVELRGRHGYTPIGGEAVQGSCGIGREEDNSVTVPGGSASHG